MIIETYNEEQTRALGRQLGEKAVPGMILTLDGDLGAGKTVFTQGFAEGLGITGPVCSPTFTILMEYDEGRLPLFHFDVYRITDPEEMEEIGYSEFFYSDGVCIIEWAELVRELIPQKHMAVVIRTDPQKGFDYRRIEIDDHTGA